MIVVLLMIVQSSQDTGIFLLIFGLFVQIIFAESWKFPDGFIIHNLVIVDNVTGRLFQ
jgi:hypothetical protein